MPNYVNKKGIVVSEWNTNSTTAISMPFMILSPGAICDFDINECASVPCKFGGTCIDGENSYTCRCELGYSGTNCATVGKSPLFPPPLDTG